MEYFNGSPLRHMGDLPAMGAHRYGEKTAFRFYADELSYADLDEQARRVANVLVDAGVEPGDRVGLMIPNTLEFPVAYFGAIKAGGVPTPLNLRMDPETLVFVLDDAGASVCLVTPDKAAADIFVCQSLNLDLGQAGKIGNLIKAQCGILYQPDGSCLGHQKVMFVF